MHPDTEAQSASFAIGNMELKTKLELFQCAMEKYVAIQRRLVCIDPPRKSEPSVSETSWYYVRTGHDTPPRLLSDSEVKEYEENKATYLEGVKFVGYMARAAQLAKSSACVPSSESSD